MKARMLVFLVAWVFCGCSSISTQVSWRPIKACLAKPNVAVQDLPQLPLPVPEGQVFLDRLPRLKELPGLLPSISFSAGERVNLAAHVEFDQEGKFNFNIFLRSASPKGREEK